MRSICKISLIIADASKASMSIEAQMNSSQDYPVSDCGYFQFTLATGSLWNVIGNERTEPIGPGLDLVADRSEILCSIA